MRLGNRDSELRHQPRPYSKSLVLKQESRMRRTLDFLSVCCLFLSVESLTAKAACLVLLLLPSSTCQILPPSNLSLVWVSSLEFNFSWVPPPHSMKNCSYKVYPKIKGEEIPDEYVTVEPYFSKYRNLDGGHLELSVKTVCGKQESEVVNFIMSDPDLVKNFQCNVISSESTRCSWHKADNITDLRFFYRLFNNFGPENQSAPVQECPSYIDSGGCDLQANNDQAIDILFNGTLDSKPVRNIFERNLANWVKPPALTWNVQKTKDKFIISWVPPEVQCPWTYVLNYTECKTQKDMKENILTTMTLPKVPHCQYWMSIKAQHGLSETPWSEEKYFAADVDHNLMVYAAVIIPLVFAGLAIFAVVCCRKNKDIIFPTIPEPKNLLSDIYNNNNNKSSVNNLYTPEEEEEDCKITLVMDLQTYKSQQ